MTMASGGSLSSIDCIGLPIRLQRDLQCSVLRVNWSPGTDFHRARITANWNLELNVHRYVRLSHPWVSKQHMAIL